MKTTLHVVCGLPASGKTTFGLELAKQEQAAFLDSDTATDLMIQAAHAAAGYDPHDRDSPRYKETYRTPVYETLFALAGENLRHISVVIAGPFTAEVQDSKEWRRCLEARFPAVKVCIHHLVITEKERLERMKKRGAHRDVSKLAD